MDALTTEQLQILTFLLGALFLTLFLSILVVLNRKDYLRFWLYFWSVLSAAYLFLLLGDVFTILSMTALYYFLIPISGYFLYRGNLRYLGRDITLKSNIVLLVIILSTLGFLWIDTSGFTSFFIVFYATVAYMGFTAVTMVKQPQMIQRLYAIIIMLIAFMNGLFPVFVILELSLELHFTILGFFGFGLAFMMILVHYHHQQEAFDVEQRKLFYKSYHDVLTNLYNRAYLEEAYATLIKDKKHLPISIIVADLNKLKIINDKYGHEHGDKMLKSIAKIFTDFTDNQDINVRYGGDEFVVLLPQTTYKETLELAASIERRTRNIRIKDIPLDIAIGVATTESLSMSLEALFKQAEEEMYSKK